MLSYVGDTLRLVFKCPAVPAAANELHGLDNPGFVNPETPGQPVPAAAKEETSFEKPENEEDHMRAWAGTAVLRGLFGPHDGNTESLRFVRDIIECMAELENRMPQAVSPYDKLCMAELYIALGIAMKFYDSCYQYVSGNTTFLTPQGQIASMRLTADSFPATDKELKDKIHLCANYLEAGWESFYAIWITCLGHSNNYARTYAEVAEVRLDNAKQTVEFTSRITKT